MWIETTNYSPKSWHEDLNHYSLVLLFYTPWKHQKPFRFSVFRRTEKQKPFRFSGVFRGYRKATLNCDGLTSRKLGVISDSVSYELWLPGLVEFTKMTFLFYGTVKNAIFRKYWVNCKKITGKIKIMYFNLYKLTLSQLFFDGF